MKISFTFKDPDYTDDCADITELQKAKRLLEDFVEYGEYVTLIVDTEKKTVELMKMT